MTIFEAIREDHDKQRDLLKKLIETSGDTDDRHRLFLQVKKELQVHADAEERYFYKRLISSDMMQEKARHGIAEHHEIDELIEELEDMEYDSSGWLKIAKKLRHEVEHHLDDEEHSFFQLAGKVFSEKEKHELSKSYQEHMTEYR